MKRRDLLRHLAQHGVRLPRSEQMEMDSLTTRIDNALAQAQFTEFFRDRIHAPAVRQLYEANQRCVLTSTESISVGQRALRALASELDSSLGSYRSPSGSVGNGLYLLTGSGASPRLPSTEEYAKVLVLAAARIGSERVAELFAGWLQGNRVRRRNCALLKGVQTEGVLEPTEGMRLETPPLNVDDLDIRLRLDDYGKIRDPFEKQAMLVIEYETICPLYEPESFRESFPPAPLPATLVNPELASLSFDDFCRALSLATNHFVDWSRQWQDYGEVEAFFLQRSSSGPRKESRGPAMTRVVSEEEVRDALSTHHQLRECRELDLPLARWLRSKRSPAAHEQLVELRIALESVFLHHDLRGPKSFRIAVRGAWFLGETFAERKLHFSLLQEVYHCASAVIHAEKPKLKQGRDLGKMIEEAQNLCRTAMLRFARDKMIPDRSEWSDMILGRRVDDA